MRHAIATHLVVERFVHVEPLDCHADLARVVERHLAEQRCRRATSGDSRHRFRQRAIAGNASGRRQCSGGSSTNHHHQLSPGQA